MMKFILPKLYDIRHRSSDGSLDLPRMMAGDRVVWLRDGTSRQSVGAPLRHLTSRVSPHRSPLSSLGATAVFEERFRLEAGYRDGIPLRRRIPAVFFSGLLIVAAIVPLLAFVRNVRNLEGTLVASTIVAAGKLSDGVAAMAKMDLAHAQQAFDDAEETFRDAKERFSSAGFGVFSLAAELPLSSKVRSAKAILEAGEAFAAGGLNLSRALAAFPKISSEVFLEGERGAPPASEDFGSAMATAADAFQRALRELSRVDAASLPKEYRESAAEVFTMVPKFKERLGDLRDSAEVLSRILGMREPRRYLVLLQNSSELRPAGGFIGNVAVIELTRGAMKDLRIEDTYLFDGQLRAYTVPPKPIQDISAAWSLHDANWFRDFPLSASIAASFFEQGGGATPDGVIAVTSRLVEKILAVTGPIVIPQGVSVDAASFTDTLNAIGTLQKPGETTQVRTVSAILPRLLEKLGALEGEDRHAIVDIVREAIAGGDLQVWFRDEKEEKLVQRLGMSGELPETRGDFLAVVHANINGFKTDRVIEETLSHEVEISADGTMLDTVTLTRRHKGNERTESFYRKVNKDYVRLLVPKGSELLSADGVTCDPYVPPVDYVAKGYRVDREVARVESSVREVGCVDVGEESGKTFFGAWLFVSPGETLVARFTYRVPLRIMGDVGSYRLLIVKQPGWEPNVAVRVSIDPAWKIPWHDESFMASDEGTLVADLGTLRSNRFMGVVVKRGE